MESNRYTLKNYIAISTFNAESSHKIEVRINKRKILLYTLILLCTKK
jgi:hypothetical protein